MQCIKGYKVIELVLAYPHIFPGRGGVVQVFHVQCCNHDVGFLRKAPNMLIRKLEKHSSFFQNNAIYGSGK